MTRNPTMQEALDAMSAAQRSEFRDNLLRLAATLDDHKPATAAGPVVALDDRLRRLINSVSGWSEWIGDEAGLKTVLIDIEAFLAGLSGRDPMDTSRL